MSLPVGVQLYTVRDACARDFLATLRAVRALGYRHVEGFWSLFGAARDDVARVLREEGLAMPAAHVDLQTLDTALDAALDLWGSLGCQTLVCPWVDEETRSGPGAWDRLGDRLAAIGEKVADAGLALCYHNHDFELRDDDVLARLLARCPARHLGLELDVFWAAHAGRDPAAYLRDHAERIRLVHLKDGTHEPLSFRPLGAGELDLDAVLTAVGRTAAVALFVEQDEAENDPFEDLRRSAVELRRRGLLA